MVGTLVVNPRDWLEADGSLPAGGRLRARALRVAQLIESAGPVPQGMSRETLVACKRRPGNTPCLGLLWVAKEDDDTISVFCMLCHQVEMVIDEWQDTLWAEGPMEPIDPAMENEVARAEEGSRGVDKRAGQVLQMIGSLMSPSQLVQRMGFADTPMEMVSAIMESANPPPTMATIQRALPLLIDLWNDTPRRDLGGRTPSQAAQSGGSHAASPVLRPVPATAERAKVGRNDPCPCGSGLKHKKCCLKPFN